ncbi:MAG: PEP-CTERM sorting domain-containing protein [Lentisphaeria bacterium]
MKQSLIKTMVGGLVSGMVILSFTASANALLEARQTSWTNDLTSLDNQTSHAGRLTSGEYINGMWSYYALQYALGSSPSSFSQVQMNYHNNPYGDVFARTGLMLPNINKTELILQQSYMGDNTNGAAVAFTNVFTTPVTVAISGSYALFQNNNNRDVNSWIYVVSTGGTTAVLKEATTYVEGAATVTVTLDSPLVTTLQPGDMVYVAVGSPYGAGVGDHYKLYDNGLNWYVTIPEPASLALLALGGLAGLRRRRARTGR